MKGINEARRELAELGLADEQTFRTMTGMGLRRIPGCAATDSVLNKYRAGALSAHGVMGVLFGSDSPQHHAGHNR